MEENITGKLSTFSPFSSSVFQIRLPSRVIKTEGCSVNNEYFNVMRVE